MDESTSMSDWRQWLESHSPKLLFFARQQSRSETDAQDLVQEAVIDAWQKQKDGTPPPLPLVYATLRRRAIDLARRENRRAGREMQAFESMPEAWFDTSIEDGETSQLIQNALTRLPSLHREVISLKIWGELTFSEIAEILGISPNTAASRYRYGMEELRKLSREVLT